MVNRIRAVVSNFRRSKREYMHLAEQYSKENARLKHTNEMFIKQNKDLKNQLEQAKCNHVNESEVIRQNSKEVQPVEDSEKITKMESEIIKYRNQLKRLQNSMDESCSEYVKIFKTISMCASLEQFIIDYFGRIDFDNLSVENKVKMANVAGTDFSLAREICVYLEKYKKLHKEFISEEELEMVKVVNEYYHMFRHKKCNYDVLDLLGFDFSKKNEFKRKSMKDIDEIGKNDFIYVTGVYVPALKTEEDNGLERKAIVKGD